MKYLNEQKTLVQIENIAIHRGHRFWNELNIAAAEEAGEIELYSKPEPTNQQLIDALESKQTKRMLREVALGNEDSIAKLQAIEDEIAELRKQL